MAIDWSEQDSNMSAFNKANKSGYEKYSDDWENYRRRQIVGERGSYPQPILDTNLDLTLKSVFRNQLQNIEHFKEMKENVLEAIRKDEREIENRTEHLRYRHETLLNIEAQINEYTLKSEASRKKLNELQAKQKSLELEIEFLQEDPGNDESIQLLKKELEELINKL